MLVRMRFEKLTDEENKMIRSFLNWLIGKIFIYLNRPANRRKIALRIEYIKKVKWIEWNNKEAITVDEVMMAIRSCFKVRKKKLIWEIYFDNRVMIPYSNTPITVLLRFLDAGDNIVKGTGMIQFIRRRFTHIQLNKWWKGYILLKTGNPFTRGKIISDS